MEYACRVGIALRAMALARGKRQKFTTQGFQLVSMSNTLMRSAIQKLFSTLVRQLPHVPLTGVCGHHLWVGVDNGL